MTTFADLGLPQPLLHQLHREGMTTPFPIQAAAIPDALAGRDVLGRGPTGSGKTLSFGLPILARLSASGHSLPAHPRAVILAPTRELAIQIESRLAPLAAAVGLRVLAVVGGVNINHHIRSLARPVDVLVATPGRAQDLINQRKLFFDAVNITAIDEADHMADMGFLPQVRRLLAATDPQGQRLLFSATLDGDVGVLVQQFMNNPVEHATAPPTSAVSTMSHHILLVGNRDHRNDVVIRIGARTGKTIMFMRTKHGVDRQVRKLRRVGIAAEPLHGDKGQGARTRAIEGFAAGTVPVLVATDVAARGIDIAEVDLVVHVDPPAEHKAYVHRSGRTARGGASGMVVTLVMDEQRTEVAELIRRAGVDAEYLDLNEHPNPASDPRLAQLTGARKPPGVPLPPPGAPQPTRQSAQSTRQTAAAASGRQPRRPRRGSHRPPAAKKKQG